MSVEASSLMSVSTQDAVVRASGGVEGYVSEGVSVSAGGMWLRSGDALSVSSVSESRDGVWRPSGGGGGRGHGGERGRDDERIAGTVSVASTGAVGVTGSAVSVESSSSLRALGVESVSVESQGRCR